MKKFLILLFITAPLLLIGQHHMFHLAGQGGGTGLLEGVVAYYDFDESAGSGTAVDSMGSYNMTYYNNPTFGVTGKIGNCVALNGNNEYIGRTTSDNAFCNSTANTFSIWIQKYGGSGTGTSSCVYSRFSSVSDRCYLLNISDSDGAAPYRSNASYYDSDDASTGNNLYSPGSDIWASWTHIVFVRSNDDITVYVNGVSVGSRDNYANGAMFQSTTSLTLDRVGVLYNGTLTQHFYGAVDQFIVWNRALSSDDVAVLYNSGDGLPLYLW